VVNAFASVPREQFVGPGPWRINSPMGLAEYWTTDDDSPSHVYHDVLIALMSRAASTTVSRAFGPICSIISTSYRGNRYSTSAVVPVTTQRLLPSLLAQPGGLPQ